MRSLNSDVKAFITVIQFNSFCQQVDDWMLLRITEKIIRRNVFEERKTIPGYRIYSINRPGRLLIFWTLRVGAYSTRGGRLFEAGRLLNFLHFQQVNYVSFCNKTRRSNKARFL